MARQHNYTVEGAAMFDGPPQANEQRTFNDLFAEPVELRQMVEGTGFYYALPNESLLKKAEIYFINHIDKIRSVLNDSGTPADVIDVVTTDYVNALSGPRVPKATPDQMKTALKAIKPYKAYSIDRYGLYWALLLNYSRCLNMRSDFQYDVAGVAATPESKKEFLQGIHTPAEAMAVLWLANIGELSPAQFAIDNDHWHADFVNLINYTSYLGQFYGYSSLYFVAKYALLATPQELDEITKPTKGNSPELYELAEQFAAEAQQRLGKTADKYGAAFEAEKTAEKEQAAEGANNWRDNIPLHETTNIICSMPVQISPNGPVIRDTMQIQQVIAGVTVANPGFGLITPMTVQKVFEGVNLLPHYCTPQIIENGKLQYNVSHSKFAEICGYQDANQNEKLALLGSLIMLNNLYIVINRPIRCIENTARGGKKYKKKIGGRTAVQILNVPEFDKENITIIVTPEAFKGRPTFITIADYKKLRDEAKGLSQSRFNYQLLSKGHKAENDLANEVFGYDEKLQLAANDPEALKRVKRSICNHKSRDINTIAKWFEDYQAKGIITYTHNPRTKVFTWDRVTPLTEQEKELLKNYDPATEAEEQ